MLVYFFIYTIRIKGWNFGFGLIANGVGSLTRKVKNMKDTRTKA
jgi:ATP-binding cassette, subfamily G (WHITE), member 2, SNQ2